MRQVVAFSSRCSSNGSGRFEARPAQGREQPVRGVRLVFGVGQDPHDLAYRRGVPELCADTRPGGRLGQDGLEFFLLGAGEFRRVLVPRMAGQDPAHPGGPPLGRPFLHRPLRPLDRLSDDARIGATGGVQDRLGLHPGEHATAGTLPPPDQDGCFFRGDPDPHAPTASETAQETHETRPRPMTAINLGWQSCFITVIRHPQPPRGRRVQIPPYFAMNRLNSNNQIR